MPTTRRPSPPAPASPLLPGHILHEFNPASGSNPALSAATRAHLHWAEPAGVAATDYDLYVLDSALGSVLASSTTTQDGTQDAYEYVINAGGSFPAGSRLVVAKKTGAGTRMLNVQWFRGRLTYATAGATRGHAAAANALGVAATPAAIESIRQKLGLDRPIWEQFGIYVANLLRGDLGTSLTTHEPVPFSVNAAKYA